MLKKHIINPLDPKETDSAQAFWEVCFNTSGNIQFIHQIYRLKMLTFLEDPKFAGENQFEFDM